MMRMDYDSWRFWLDGLQAALTAGIGIYVWLVNRTRVNAARIGKLEEEIDSRIDRHDVRITRIEERIKRGPTREDLNRIHQRLDETASSVSRLAGEFHAAKGTLDLIHQFLLNEGKR